MTAAEDHGPRVGASAEVGLVVAAEDTALALGSGEGDVLGTPRVLGLAEAAARSAVEDDLAPGLTTVGTWAELRHRRPSRVGDEVRATAELTEVDGRRLTFAIEVRDASGEILATVAHRRAIVARADF